jgi:hypothetical protein
MDIIKMKNFELATTKINIMAFLFSFLLLGAAIYLFDGGLVDWTPVKFLIKTFPQLHDFFLILSETFSVLTIVGSVFIFDSAIRQVISKNKNKYNTISDNSLILSSPLTIFRQTIPLSAIESASIETKYNSEYIVITTKDQRYKVIDIPTGNLKDPDSFFSVLKNSVEKSKQESSYNVLLDKESISDKKAVIIMLAKLFKLSNKDALSLYQQDTVYIRSDLSKNSASALCKKLLEFKIPTSVSQNIDTRPENEILDISNPPVLIPTSVLILVTFLLPPVLILFVAHWKFTLEKISNKIKVGYGVFLLPIISVIFDQTSVIKNINFENPENLSTMLLYLLLILIFQFIYVSKIFTEIKRFDKDFKYNPVLTFLIGDFYCNYKVNNLMYSKYMSKVQARMEGSEETSYTACKSQ